MKPIPRRSFLSRSMAAGLALGVPRLMTGAEPRSGGPALNRLVRERQSAVIDRAGWKLIDEAERSRGTERGRIREKITDQAELARIAGAAGRGTETSVLGRLRRRR